MISRLLRLPLAVAAIAVPAAAFANTDQPSGASQHAGHSVSANPLVITMMDAKGAAIGKATLRDTSGGLLIDLDLKGLPAGEKAFHVHQTGKCTPADGFASAGGHFAPAHKSHGLMVAEGPHAGDMPNLFVGKDGKVRMQVLNGSVSLGAGDASLADADGSALVIHSGPDDYTSQPAGNAGGRIACGVIFAPKQ